MTFCPHKGMNLTKICMSKMVYTENEVEGTRFTTFGD